jgi:F420-dependent oxidoreductase-like protein
MSVAERFSRDPFQRSHVAVQEFRTSIDPSMASEPEPSRDGERDVGELMAALNAGLVIRRGSADDLVRRVKQADERGIATVWTTVGGPTADPVTAYAAAGAMTGRVMLGTAVTPTYPRHPITLAAQAIALNDLAPGRIRLGIGTSHKPTIEGSYGIPMGKPLAHLREYLTILRALLWEGKAEFSGTYFTVKTALPEHVPAPNIPVPISALRQNAFRLAGELADGAISWVTPVDYLVETAIPAMDEGAAKSGRQRPPLIAHVPVALTTDRAAGREAFRQQFSIYGRLPFYAAMFEAAGFPVDDAGRMSDGLVETLAVVGDADEIRERLTAILARGIDEVMISHVVVGDEASELETISGILAG